MTKINDIIQAIETLAPRTLQESWDNCGVQVGYDISQEVKGVVLSLDVTYEAVEMAVNNGYNLVICHHPMTISGVKTFTNESEVGRIISLAIKNDIVIYSAHTSLDSCFGGLNDKLAELFELQNIRPLCSHPSGDNVGIGRIGTLSSELTAEQLATLVKKRLSADGVRYCDSGKTIKTLAICSGSGGSLLSKVKESGADGYLCSDLKYHNFTEMATDGISMVDVGHFESEICAIDIFKRVISENFCTFAVLECRNNTIKHV